MLTPAPLFAALRVFGDVGRDEGARQRPAMSPYGLVAAVACWGSRRRHSTLVRAPFSRPSSASHRHPSRRRRLARRRRRLAAAPPQARPTRRPEKGRRRPGRAAAAQPTPRWVRGLQGFALVCLAATFIVESVGGADYLAHGASRTQCEGFVAALDLTEPRTAQMVSNSKSNRGELGKDAEAPLRAYEALARWALPAAGTRERLRADGRRRGGGRGVAARYVRGAARARGEAGGGAVAADARDE